MKIKEQAKAKINLCLHVLGQDKSHYHKLDSIVVFANYGDALTFQSSEKLSFNVLGPFADSLTEDADNLILKMLHAFDHEDKVKVLLAKNLPVAAGIGGGSADAAATARGLTRLWKCPLPHPEKLLSLGSDIPVCVTSRSSRVRGVGDEITNFPALSALPCLLVNPGQRLMTAQVFDALIEKHNPGILDIPEKFTTQTDFFKWLGRQRNDLQMPASTLVPEIQDILDALDFLGSRLSRMSGSGSTCFGLFSDIKSAQHASERLRTSQPGWWVKATTLN